MKVEFDLDEDVLAEFGMSEDDLAQAIKYAVGNMTHPQDGTPCYINSGLRVSVHRDGREVASA